MNFKDTSLWKSSQANVAQVHEEVAERLRVELVKSRAKAGILTSRIAASFPNLTLHEISHLDGLWDVASHVVGSAFQLNPLEAFVFGEAILLHDAALCFEAYEGGKTTVRETEAWKDAMALEHRQRPETSKTALEELADFIAVRNLHAREAARLAERKWQDPATGDALFLIEDSHLRKHLGGWIGQIAASHHWSIEDVKAILPRQINVPAEFPGEWSIEPRKLACLLRCADALHIDNRRAPDFFHALLHRSGISFQHWQAQNQIGTIALDKSDSSGRTILLTTTFPFVEAHASSWWVIFDAANVAQRELETSNALLIADECKPFQVTRIRGVESPELMAAFVRAEGWTPCAAKIHISNVEQLVGRLGGHQLYGNEADPLAIAFRELVQNARDAIKARARVEPEFVGEIKVHVTSGEPAKLEVSDNGLGMSRRVLTGPLLDFGTSFWASSLVQSEFPGLSSSGFSPVGRFGIGFYSVFMAADRVTVASKRWDEGLKDTHTLEFPGGLALRPLLKEGSTEAIGPTNSTRVSIVLKPGLVRLDRKVLIKPGVVNEPEFLIDLADYLAVMIAGLDVDVVIDIEGAASGRHQSQPAPPSQRLNWLKRIAYTKYRTPEALDLLLTATGDRLRPILFEGRCIGLAAIATLPQNQLLFCSVPTVGGLAMSAQGGRSNFYVGYIDHPPRSARRETGDRVEYAEALKPWAEEQAALLEAAQLHPIQRCAAAYSLAEFGVNPAKIGRVYVWVEPNKSEFLAIAELVERLRSVPILFCRTAVHDHVDSSAQVRGLPGIMVFQPISNGKFNSLKIVDGVPAEQFGALACIYRAMLEAGLIPVWETREKIAQSMLGVVEGVVLKSRTL